MLSAPPFRNLVACLTIIAIVLQQVDCKLHFAAYRDGPGLKQFFLPRATDTTISLISPQSSILQISFPRMFVPAQELFVLATTPITSYTYNQHISTITIILKDSSIPNLNISLRLVNTQTSALSEYMLNFVGAASVYFQPGKQVSICRQQQKENSSICKVCDQACLTCYGESNYCTSCVKPLYARNGRCLDHVKNCNDGYYQKKGLCEACSIQCLTCNSNHDQCTSCAEKMYLDGSRCKSCNESCNKCSKEPENCISCAEGYQNITKLPGSKCILKPSIISQRLLITCDPSCITCSIIPTNCTSCLPYLSLVQGQCLRCQKGQFLKISVGFCDRCSQNCDFCIDQSQCTRCNTNFYLQNQLCVANCSAGYFLSNTNCLKCDNKCLTCAGTATNCTSCIAGKFLSVGQCLNCDASCTKCAGTATNCTQCLFQMSLVHGSCLFCAEGQYTNNWGTCDKCPIGCLTCSPEKTCSRCNTSYSLVGQTCLLNCLTGNFLNMSTVACQKCDSSCLNCSVTASNCTACFSSQFVMNGECLACDYSCRTCQVSSTNCLSCALGFQKYSSRPGKCQSLCPPSTFYSGLFCLSCNQSCQSCQVRANNCTSCKPNYVLVQGSCISCKEGTYYRNTSNDCQACSPNCLSCMSDALCTRCNTSFFLQNQACLAVCPSEYFLKNDTCSKCDVSCLTCEGTANNCSSCISTQFLAGGQCQACDVSCAKCMGSAVHCLSCSAGFSNSSTMPGKCVFSCGPEQFFSGSFCAPCSSKCLSCQGTATNCTSCISFMFLIQGACLFCPQGQFLNDGICQKCPKGCISCLKDKTCSKCSAAYSLQNATCISQCSAGTFSNSDTCQSCDPQCLTCDGTANNCTSCLTAQFLLSGQCQACDVSCAKCMGSAVHCLSCSAGFSNSSTMPGKCVFSCGPEQFFSGSVCAPCSSKCLSCQGTATNCTSCSPYLQLVQGSCLYCQSGQYLNDWGMCQSCSDGCITCLLDKKCTKCRGNFTLINFACETLCSVGYFTNNISNCQICDANCLTCVGQAKNCASCRSNSTNPYLFQFKCISACPNGTAPLIGKCLPASMSKASSTQSSIMPFPICLIFTILGGTSIISKALVSKTLLVSCLCAFAGTMECFSWILGIFLLYSAKIEEILLSICLYTFAVACFILFFLNCINLYLFRRYIYDDEKFRRNYQTLKASKLKQCICYIMLGLTLFVSHKFIELLFSNFAKLRLFTFKVKTIHKLHPQKYIRIISLFPSLIAIGSSAVLYLQFKQSQGHLYWEAMDIIAISTISAVTSIWVTRRRPEDFQNSVGDKSLNIQNFNVGDDPAPEIHFQELRKEEQPSGQGHHLQSYKHSVNTTEQNLINRPHEQPSEDQHYYDEIHVVAREKDDQGELNQTRLTYKGNSKKKPNDSIQNSNHDSLNEEILPMKSVRQVKQRRRSSRSRQRNKRFIQEEPRPIHIIQANFTQKEIQLMRVIRRADEVATIVNEIIRQELRNSEHRLKPNGELYEIFNFLMNLSDNEVGVLQRKTRLTLQGIQQTILRLQSAKILPQEFLDYLNQIDQRQKSFQKQNYTPNSHLPMPPLPKHKTGECRKNRSSKNRSSKGSSHEEKDQRQQRQQGPNQLSPKVNQFNHSPLRANKEDTDHVNIPQSYQVGHLRYPPHPPRCGKTPNSYEVEDEVRESDHQDAVQVSLRPYQRLVSHFHHQKPRRSSFQRRKTEEQQQKAEIQQEDDVHLEDGLSSLKKEASGLKQNNGASPPSPFITFSRLQQINSFTFNDPADGLEMNTEFAGGASVAQVMNKYSKNGQRQQADGDGDGDDIPDEDDDKFKRLRRKRQGRRRNSTNGE